MDNGTLRGIERIARYLKTSPKQVKAWQKQDGLPIYRAKDTGPWLAEAVHLDDWKLRYATQRVQQEQAKLESERCPILRGK